MSYLTVVILLFSILGAFDRILGNRFGMGKEFEKAFMLLGSMALSMIGMIVISPFIADIIQPLSNVFATILNMDPSIIPASFFANDMGGTPLSIEMAISKEIGMYNALVVSSMMGCTISYTLPVSLGIVKKEQHKALFLGISCGVATLPIGCIVAGLICKIPFFTLLYNLVPIILFSGIITIGIVKIPGVCIKMFQVFGSLITVLVTLGLSLGIIRFLTGVELIKGLAKLEEGAAIVINAAIVLSGALPLMYVMSKVLSKPLKVVARKVDVNEESLIGLLSSLANSATTFGFMDEMNKKGVVINAAFAVCGAFSFGGHLAFTMSFGEEYVFPVIIGKLISGVSAVLLAFIIYNKSSEKI